MTVTPTRTGRPSNADLARRVVQERRAAARLLTQALQHLNHPSRLSESPLCQLEGVKRQAAALGGYHYPRAHIVIEAVRQAYAAAWNELGETADGCCLAALADALQGLTRQESARKAGVSLTGISRRRREAVEMIIDDVLVLLHGP